MFQSPLHLFLTSTSQCLESLPPAQYQMLSVVLYLGPMFFLFIGHVFFVCILIYAFIPLKQVVKHVSSGRKGLRCGSVVHHLEYTLSPLP